MAPEDYAVIRKLAEEKQLTLRVAYSLFAQKAGSELDDYKRWIGMTKPGEGDDMLRVAGAGENLVWSAADFENFLQPRPDLKPVMEGELDAVIRALGGGIAIQHRMAYQGEYFIRRYGRDAARACPPVREMLAAGIPVGARTDGTRVASYHPWTCLYWLATGRTVGGTEVTAEENRLSREQALSLYTEGSAWFSGESGRKGRIAVDRFADFAVLSTDYLSCPDEEIRRIESVLTVCDGKIVHAAGDFAKLAPPLPPVSPSWSPVAVYGGYANEAPAAHSHQPVFGADGRLWEMGCGCLV